MTLGEFTHNALVGAKAFNNDSLATLRKVAQDLDQKVEILAISSIYRIRGVEVIPEHIHDLRRQVTFEGVGVVFRIGTSFAPEELLAFLQALERQHRGEVMHRATSLNLLAFDNMTRLTLDLTLPHPEFHLRPEYVIPSAEVWGDYVHPVLDCSLFGLAENFQNEDWGDFLAQGQSLLAFSGGQD